MPSPRASQRAIEGQWLRDYSSRLGARKELIVVGDFAQQSLNFVQAVNEMMGEHHVRLFKIDAIDALVDEIRHAPEPDVHSII
jgi:hypothetical protein